MKKATVLLSILILSIFIFASNQLVFAQTTENNTSTIKSNAIYGSAGVLTTELYFAGIVYYERCIKQNMWNTNISSFVKAGYGAYGTFLFGTSIEGRYALAQYGFLMGPKNHHLELSAGPSYYIRSKGNPDYEYPISGTLGYRYQKPEGNFIFRTGAAYPEAFYIGIGFSF